jgi:hypothetical protein
VTWLVTAPTIDLVVFKHWLKLADEDVAYDE